MSPAEVTPIGATQIAQQALYFGLLVVILSLSGSTLLGWLRVGVPSHLAVFFGPPLTLAAWSLALGIGVGAGIPIKNFFLAVWLVTLGLAAYACRPTFLRAVKPDWRVVLAVLAAPIAITAPYFRWGLTTFAGSPYLDGWSYVAFGQYIWEYPRQTEGGLAPLYQYAARLSHVRYIGSALLGFMSPLVGKAGDTQPPLGVIFVLALFALACASVVLAASFGLGTFDTVCVVVLTVFSGWGVGLLSSNALDNSLALYSLPLLVGVARMADLRRFGWWLLMAIFASALLYTYPELAWAALLASGLVLVQRSITLRIRPHDLLLPAIAAAALAAVLMTPFVATDLLDFFRNQASSALQPIVARPGEGLFHELIQPDKRFWAFWGMTNETALCSRCEGQLGSFGFSGRGMLALILTGLAGLGLIVMARRREFAICLAIVIFLVGAAIFALGIVYAYGAWKLLAVGWSLIVLCVVVGGATLTRAGLSAGVGLAGRAAVVLVVGLYAFGVSTQVRAFGNLLPTTSFDTYGTVRSVGSIVGTEPVLVTVSNESANSWAVYELRDTPIVLDSYVGYMAQEHMIPYMQRAGVPSNAPIRYVLTDAPPPSTPAGFQPVWSQGPYLLWHTSEDGWAFISRVDAPNGVEAWSGGPGFWLGNQAVDLEITASQADQACLRAVFSPGPSSPGDPIRRIDVSSGDAPAVLLHIDGKQAQQVTVSLVPGLNHVLLSALDQPSLARISDYEGRTLLVGVENLSLLLGACQAT